MCYTPIVTARVALGISPRNLAEEVLEHSDHCPSCQKAIRKINDISFIPPADRYCLTNEEVIDAVFVQRDQGLEDHIDKCGRCGAIAFAVSRLNVEAEKKLLRGVA